jgi:hypothetical protein
MAAVSMVEGAYEAEEFFEHLGDNGRWLIFTAAPIKSSDGTLVGAIETLWDSPPIKSESKRNTAGISS